MRRRRSASPFRVGAFVLVVAVILVYLGFRKDVPFVNPPYEVQAAFRQSSGIRKNSPVRIAGVDVGKVTGIEHTGPRGEAVLLTMDIDKKGRPLHQDARAAIRPRIFLEGNFFIDLKPGSPSAPDLARNGTIPVGQTSTPVQLDQVLNTLRSGIRADLRTTFAEIFYAQAAGGAKALNRSLKFQPAAFKFSAIVSEALLGERPGDLGDYIRDQGVVSAALDRDPQALMGLISDLNTTTGALADREQSLRAAVSALPGTLRSGVRTFDRLDEAFPAVRRFASAAVEPVRSTGPAARAITPLVAQLRGLVAPDELGGLARDLRAAVPPTVKVSKTAVPLLGQLRALASCTSNVIVPFGNQTTPDAAFPATGPVFEEIPKSLVGLAGESRSSDANGQFFKILGSGGPQTVTLGSGLLGTTASPMVGVNPPPQRQISPLRGDVPCETQQPPDLSTAPGAPPATVRTDASSAAARRRERAAQQTAVESMRRSLRDAGSQLKVSARAATGADVRAGRAAVRRAAP